MAEANTFRSFAVQVWSTFPAFCKAFNLLPSLLSLTQAYVNFRASRTADGGHGWTPG